MIEVELNGLRYACVEAGEGETLLLLHGFTGSSLSWRDHIASLSRAYHVIAVDLPGHGSSGTAADPARMAFGPVSADLVELLQHRAASPAIWLGYSMGARLALFAALEHAWAVSRLVLESGSPGLATEPEREQRRRDDERLARQIEANGVDSFVKYWESLPLFSSQLDLPLNVREQARAVRLTNTAEGLAGSLRGMGTGVQPSVWTQLSQLEMPSLLIVGDRDPKFRDINRRMASVMRGAHLVRIPNAGHTPHLEQPALFQDAVFRFLSGESEKDGQYLARAEQSSEQERRQRHLSEPGIQ